MSQARSAESAARGALTLDLAVAAVLAIGSWLVASRALSHLLAVPWIEDFLVPCTGRPGWTPDPVLVQARPEWASLLAGGLPQFPCSSIAGLPLVEVGASWRQVEYFHRALGLLYRLTGPTATTFASFQAMLFMASNMAIYGLFRLVTGRAIAIAGTVALMLSRWQLEALPFPIEYAKAPWMLAAMWLCGLLVLRSLDGRPVARTAFFAGVVAGIGTGFKPDVMAAIPMALAVALVFVAGRRAKVVALASVLAGVIVGAGPLVYRTWSTTSGSLLAVQFLGGQDSAAEAWFASTPYYDYGVSFDDSHITALLNSYGQRVLGTTTPFYFFSPDMQAASTRLLVELWSTFPGDLVLRAIAAAVRLLEFAAPGVIVATLGLTALFAMHRRAGWCAVFMGGYLAAYVSLVFQRRHFFHLEVIGWWLAAVLVQACWHVATSTWRTERLPDLGRRITVAIASVIVVMASAWSVLAVARAYQQRVVTSAIAARLDAPFDARAYTAESRGEQSLLRIAGVSADSGPAPSADAMRGDYLRIALSCRDAEPVNISLVYAEAGRAWNRESRVPCAGGESTFFAAVYQYGDAYRFEGVSVAHDQVAAVRSIGVVGRSAGIGAWPQLTLPAQWQHAVLHKVMRVPPVVP